jgi:predicted transcriptional regulator
MDILRMASDLILAQIQQRRIDHETLDTWLARTHGTLLQLLLDEQFPRIQLPAKNPGDWRQSIGREKITCLVCGNEFKQLSPAHLKVHGMTARDYREKFGMPPTQPLSSRRVTRRRSEAVHRTKPWLKATAARWPNRGMR